MDQTLGVEDRYALITRRLELQNGRSGQRLQSLLADSKAIKYQWATAPTGKPHIGYFIPLIKLADFIHAGGEVLVEFLDSYAFLVNYKFPWEQVRHRTKYYRWLMTAALEAVGVPMAKVSMVDSTSYQGTPEFMVDFWKLCALCSQQDARDTGAEVGSSTMLSPLLTPLLQELGEEYLGVDVELGGTDQRGIFNLGEQFLPELGYEKRVHLMNELLPSLTGGKMSSSSPAHTKITFLDDAEVVRDKIAGASCKAGIVQGNGVLPVVQHILMPVSEIRTRHEANGTNGFKTEGTLFSVAASGGCRNYSTYAELERDYVDGTVGPIALKEVVVDALNMLLDPIREMYKGNEAWRGEDQKGYPEDWPLP
ncbi:hypothetical protein G6O67_006156 [Ophiocordyceps sinensis]|uniref:tyrosine--tRNA ligase n=1 Tax=Ophiocordyceps sinensis TaxID=72228 RepID=A0A8H4PK51_9HYPO|nr:hypothetical protein G6O67_006156 [Ophiocordyceps sinensis]